MECTQRLESTQEINSTQSEKLVPEQIGFLGICGIKYPVKKGPNKIGRDPETCNIVLNFTSVSRQHAVINILNKKDFMLMDLDSANKTKLMGETLQPYIPKPLRDGDIVHFGELFGIFRLLEEEDNLPMTQALEIPDTPIPTKNVSKLMISGTTVPESPEVSDKEDSFIVPSQPKGALHSPKMRKFIKPGRTISIQPIGSNKIDNIYWNSSKKSTSLNLGDSNTSLDDSLLGVNQSNKENKVGNVHKLETPVRSKELNASKDSIYTANTQLPGTVGPSIFTANTQMPIGDIYSASTQMPELGDLGSIHAADTQMPNAASSPSIPSMNTQLPSGSSPSIHNMNTQLPPGFVSPSIHNIDSLMPNGNLPEVCKINEQEDVQFDLCAIKRGDKVTTSETELCIERDKIPINKPSRSLSPSSVKSNKLNASDEELLFEEVDQPFEEIQESQAILTEDLDIDLPINKCVEPEPEFDILSQIPVSKSVKRNMRIGSDSSADCDDIELLPTQKLTVKKVIEDDNTDCEDDDNMIELKIDKTTVSKDLDVDCLNLRSATNKDVDFEDMPTQVLQEVDNIEKNVIKNNVNSSLNVDFEDLPTQVLAQDLPLEKQSVHSKHFVTEEDNSPFKIPCNSPLKTKRISKTPKIKPIKYYQNTQEVFEDLCGSQDANNDKNEKQIDKYVLDTSLDIDPKETSNNFVKNISSEKVLDVIVVDNHVTQIAQFPSDGSIASDVENTPKKSRHFNFNTALPDSQEIKTQRTLTADSILSLSSSDSETENNSEGQNTPIVFHKKTKSKVNVKLDLSSKFDIESLPSRVIARVRKPSKKMQETQNKKVVESMLKPKFLSEQEEISASTADVIKWNISNLKAKSSKKSNNQSKLEIKHTDLDVGIGETVKRARSSKKKTEDAVEEKIGTKNEKHTTPKEETKTKEKPKRETKNTKKHQESKTQTSLANTSSNQLSSVAEPKKSDAANKSEEVVEINSTKTSTETKRARNTRNTKTGKTGKCASLDRDNETEKPKRKYTRKTSKLDSKKEEEINESKKEEPTKLSEPVRRSSRQRKVKEEPKPKLTKSLPKSTSKEHEESVVYSLPSSSNSTDTRRRFKRSNSDNSDAPSPKRTRSAANNGRMTPVAAVKRQFVLFTALGNEKNINWKTKLENMGATVVTNIMECTMVLTKEIKRTFKLLCAVGLGKPIVGPEWVEACDRANTIVDPWLYLLKDVEGESRFHFNLQQTLTGKRNFLKGYNVSCTPSTLPAPSEMQLIVESSGGCWKEGGPRWVCISVRADSALWPSLVQRGASVVCTEFILGGVLRQRVDIEANTFKW